MTWNWITDHLKKQSSIWLFAPGISFNEEFLNCFKLEEHKDSYFIGINYACDYMPKCDLALSIDDVIQPYLLNKYPLITPDDKCPYSDDDISNSGQYALCVIGCSGFKGVLNVVGLDYCLGGELGHGFKYPNDREDYLPDYMRDINVRGSAKRAINKYNLNVQPFVKNAVRSNFTCD